MGGTALKPRAEARESDGVQIVSMLYDGAINFIGKAKEKLDIGDSSGRSFYIKKTTAIVNELSGSLNMDTGEIAVNLRSLYDFVLDRLVKADLQNNRDALSDAEKVIDIIRSSWSEMQEARKL